MKQIAFLVALPALLLLSCSGAKQTSAAGDGFEPEITHIATMKTSQGDIVIELYGKDAPKTVANFVGLAEKDFYDGILFHRVVPGFVIQAGDPQTRDESLKSQWGMGGESIYGDRFEDELDPSTPSYKRGYVEGTLAMANAGPNTNSSQFFIMTGGGLPHKYTIFGFVRSGMDVVEKIEAIPRDGERPKTPVTILDIEVDEE